jgi:hypothetical protein
MEPREWRRLTVGAVRNFDSCVTLLRPSRTPHLLPRSDIPTMSSGVNPHPLRRQPLNSTHSLLDSQPGTPWHEDDENAPLIRPGDVERAAYSATRKSCNIDRQILLVSSTFPGASGLDLESDDMKPSAQPSSIWAKAQYYIPSLQWIPNYSLSL